MSSAESDGPWPLSGWRVLDLSSQIAGPYAAKMLVDAGAEVIKVEHPDGGDPLRRWSASDSQIASDEDGALFQFLNASKRSIALDPASASGKSELLDLAASADLVIESFGPGGLERRDLEPATLRRANPALSVLSISPWGLEGPDADRPCTEFTIQAATGTIAYRGLRDRKPVFAGGRIGEWAAGTFGAVGALSAMLSARRTGDGQHVDVSMFECMLLCLTVYHDLNSQWFPGPLPRSIEIPSIEPAKDGWVGFCTITGQQWSDFCAMLGRQDIAEDETYLDGRARMGHLDQMREMIHSWTRERSIDEIIDIASMLRIPAAPVGNGRTLPEMDHMKARGVFEQGPGGFLRPRPPYRIGGSELRPFGPAPGLGEHGAAIRAELADARPRVLAGEGASALPLEGLRVVDMTTFWAGPIATTYLSDMGADVVKVESIQRPDGMRFAGSVRNQQMWEWSPVFHGANPGKRAVTLRLDCDEGMALVRRMIERADVLIENYSARVMDNFGLSWEAVHEINPRLVMVRMPAFGLDGPWRDRPGFAMTVEQVSGLAWITGYRDMPLVMRGACDPLGGMHAVFATLAALEERRRDGQGRLVEMPLVEGAINLSAEQVIEYSAYGRLLERDENRGPVSAPQGVYRSADPESLIAVAVPDDATWRALRSLLGDPEWALIPDLDDAAGRRAHHNEIDDRLEAWLSSLPVDEAAARLNAAGIPAQPLINPHDLMPNAQLEARAFFQTIEHPATG
ncbi:MAG: CoA transferase, partial [Deltaproteobacteria bacterium]|nr:CoA transferase [Deltaproteobacteria bacterium]